MLITNIPHALLHLLTAALSCDIFELCPSQLQTTANQQLLCPPYAFAISSCPQYLLPPASCICIALLAQLPVPRGNASAPLQVSGLPGHCANLTVGCFCWSQQA